MRALVLALVAMSGSVLTAQTDLDYTIDETALRNHIGRLNDPDESVRRRSAAELRRIAAKYPSDTVNIREADGGEARWKAKVAQIQLGMTAAEVETILGTFAAGPPRATGPVINDRSYQLDYHWQLRIEFARSSNTVATLPTLIRSGFVLYPPKMPDAYNGVWIGFFANGRPASVAHYLDGDIIGVPVSFYDNGQLRSVRYQDLRTYSKEGPHFDWYRDGKLATAGEYRRGVQVGRFMAWHPNGQPAAEIYYNNNGLRDGVERTWSPAGEILTQRFYRDGELITR